jgi:hypothetical protein
MNRAAHVRVGDGEPQHDGQMERDEGLGSRVRVVRVEVDHDRSDHKRRRRQRPSPDVELPSAGEEPGKERQHEHRAVPKQPAWFLVGEVSSKPCDLDHDGRSHREDERLEPAAGRARRLVVTSQDELFPQSSAVLACELPGQAVEVAHPFHGDQERLVVREAGRVQLGDLVAKMILQLIDVAAVDARGVRDVGPPLCDL